MPRKSKRVTTKRVAEIARSVLKKNTETKTKVNHGDYPISSANALSVNNKFDFFDIATGTDQSSRDGNQIRVTNLEYRIVWMLNQQVVTTTAQYPLICRVIEYTPKQDQSADLSFANIHDMPDLDNFSIHKDITFTLSPEKPTHIVTSRKWFKRPLMVQYNASTAGGTITKNERKLYFCYGTDGLHTLAAGNCLSVQYQYRYRYKDC